MGGMWGTVEGKTKLSVWLAFQKQLRELRDDDGTPMDVTDAAYAGGIEGQPAFALLASPGVVGSSSRRRRSLRHVRQLLAAD